MLGKLTFVMDVATKGFTKGMDEAKGSISGVQNDLSSLQGGLGGISPAFDKATGGIQKMSAAGKALNMALGPIGLIIGAIALAVSALTAYFKGSVDGQQKFAEITGYLSGILTVFKDILIDVGRWLVWAFQNPREAIDKLIEMIKTNLTNRFKGMVDMITSGWEVISKGATAVGLAVASIFDKSKRDEAKKAFADMRSGMIDFGKAALMAYTGIEDLEGKFLALGEKVAAKAKESAELASRKTKLQLEEIGNMSRIARLEAEISAARRISNDDTKTITEQIEAQERAMELVNQKFAIQQKMAQERLAIQRQTNALGESNIDDLKAAAELEAQLIGLEAARDNEVKSLLRRYNTLQKQKEAEVKATQDALDAEMKARQQVLEEIRVAGLTEIEIIEETLAKQLASHKWSADERKRIEEHYQTQIKGIKDQAAEEEAAKQAEVLNRIRENYMSQEELLRQSMEKELAMFEGNEAEKFLVRQFYNDELAKIDEQYRIDKLNKDMEALGMIQQAMGVFSQFQIAAMNNELKAAGDNAEKRAAIEKKYAQRRKQTMIAEAIASAAMGVLKALQSPPPMSFVMAGLAASMGAAQVATIASAPMKTGGVVPPGYPNDTYPAMLTSGETVIPPKKLPAMGDDIVVHGEITNNAIYISSRNGERRRKLVE